MGNGSGIFCQNSQISCFGKTWPTVELVDAVNATTLRTVGNCRNSTVFIFWACVCGLWRFEPFYFHYWA